MARLKCNIDARGKLVRMIYGMLLLLAGVAMLVLWAIPSHTMVGWILSLVAMLAGAFAIFESRTGWCVLRAIGIQTRF